VSDALRIDLALARATGLPARSANDASVTRDIGTIASTANTDALFSPLALLLTRFLPPSGTPAPTPTPEEARLLLAYLQQRVVAVLHNAGAAVPPMLRVSVDTDGALHLAPAPADGDRLAMLLRHDPDITRLADVLRRPVPAMITPDQMANVEADASARAAPAPLRSAPDLRRAWPWRLFADTTDDVPSARSGITTVVEASLVTGALAALLLAWWFLS
jgi:hypothetical protein